MKRKLKLKLKNLIRRKRWERLALEIYRLMPEKEADCGHSRSDIWGKLINKVRSKDGSEDGSEDGSKDGSYRFSSFSDAVQDELTSQMKVCLPICEAQCKLPLPSEGKAEKSDRSGIRLELEDDASLDLRIEAYTRLLAKLEKPELKEYVEICWDIMAAWLIEQEKKVDKYNEELDNIQKLEYTPGTRPVLPLEQLVYLAEEPWDLLKVKTEAWSGSVLQGRPRPRTDEYEWDNGVEKEVEGIEACNISRELLLVLGSVKDRNVQINILAMVLKSLFSSKPSDEDTAEVRNLRQERKDEMRKFLLPKGEKFPKDSKTLEDYVEKKFFVESVPSNLGEYIEVIASSDTPSSSKRQKEKYRKKEEDILAQFVPELYNSDNKHALANLLPERELDKLFNMAIRELKVAELLERIYRLWRNYSEAKLRVYSDRYAYYKNDKDQVAAKEIEEEIEKINERHPRLFVYPYDIKKGDKNIWHTYNEFAMKHSHLAIVLWDGSSVGADHDSYQNSMEWAVRFKLEGYAGGEKQTDMDELTQPANGPILHIRTHWEAVTKHLNRMHERKTTWWKPWKWLSDEQPDRFPARYYPDDARISYEDENGKRQLALSSFPEVEPGWWSNAATQRDMEECINTLGAVNNIIQKKFPLNPDSGFLKKETYEEYIESMYSMCDSPMEVDNKPYIPFPRKKNRQIFTHLQVIDELAVHFSKKMKGLLNWFYWSMCAVIVFSCLLIITHEGFFRATNLSDNVIDSFKIPWSELSNKLKGSGDAAGHENQEGSGDAAGHENQETSGDAAGHENQETSGGAPGNKNQEGARNPAEPSSNASFIEILDPFSAWNESGPRSSLVGPPVHFVISCVLWLGILCAIVGGLWGLYRYIGQLLKTIYKGLKELFQWMIERWLPCLVAVSVVGVLIWLIIISVNLLNTAEKNEQWIILFLFLFLWCFALLCLCMIAALWCIVMYRWKNPHIHYYRLRTLTECLRVQFYWNIMGSGRHVSGSFRSQQIDAVTWLRTALNGVEVTLRRNESEPWDIRNRVRMLDKVWLETQKNYHDKRLVSRLGYKLSKDHLTQKLDIPEFGVINGLWKWILPYWNGLVSLVPLAIFIAGAIIYTYKMENFLFNAILNDETQLGMWIVMRIIIFGIIPILLLNRYWKEKIRQREKKDDMLEKLHVPYVLADYLLDTILDESSTEEEFTKPQPGEKKTAKDRCHEILHHLGVEVLAKRIDWLLAVHKRNLKSPK
ncbi:MAG: hypothetical protein E7029_07855 [Planctomycetaceae bacterium]|nr:hypothetical protein [Planctomycetaceae bacterium]